MAEFVYGVSSYERRRGDFPELPVVNMLAENVPTEPGTALQARPGLEYEGTTIGDGPVQAIYRADGVFDNALFVVSNYKVYKDGVLLGTINGTGSISMAAYEDRFFVNAGKEIWCWDGTDFKALAFPDGAEVSKIVIGASRLVASRKDTGQFYWTDVLSTNIDGLSFATAEYQPDRLKDMLYIGDRMYMFGAETVEIWPTTTDSDLPFAPLPGTVMNTGIKATGLATKFGETFAWITNNNEVCLSGPDNIISEPELQVRIRNSSTQAMWTFFVDDNEFLVVQLNDQTWVYGERSGLWSKFESHGYNNWVAICYDDGYFGTSVDGQLAQWSDGYSDFGGPVNRRFRAWAPITSEAVLLSNVIMRTNPGSTPFITGSFTDPIVELRTSRDGGNEWQPWIQRNMGAQGKYRRKTIWRSLGQFGYPGLMVEIRNSDPTPFRTSGLAYNEMFGGR